MKIKLIMMTMLVMFMSSAAWGQKKINNPFESLVDKDVAYTYISPTMFMGLGNQTLFESGKEFKAGDLKMLVKFNVIANSEAYKEAWDCVQKVIKDEDLELLSARAGQTSNKKEKPSLRIYAKLNEAGNKIEKMLLLSVKKSGSFKVNYVVGNIDIKFNTWDI